VAYAPADPDRYDVTLVAMVDSEPRDAYAREESRSEFAPFESRVYYASSKAAPRGPPNRRRIL
jgi:hypothetical protein